MQITVTIAAHCTYCARRFVVLDPATEVLSTTASLGDLIFCDDLDGKLCCTRCLCAYCGHGHATEGDRDQCDIERFEQGTDDDGDAFRDRAFDIVTGVI
jgi:hypothetical protein